MVVEETLLVGDALSDADAICDGAKGSTRMLQENKNMIITFYSK